ncbi:MAG: PAS domain S-box protein [Cyanobacteria bacterium SBC]|nr:PAS domain S-box protein [Cyanobacteria bacterium SBC]
MELTSAIVRDPLVVSPDTKFIEAIAQMSDVRSVCNTLKTVGSRLENLQLDARSSGAVVVEDGRVVGILTAREVVRSIAQQQPIDRLTIKHVMSHPVVTLHESAFTNLLSAIHLLQQHDLRYLPVLDDLDRLVGFVTDATLRQTFQPIDLLQLRRVSDLTLHETIDVTPDRSLLAISQLMARHCVSSVVVVEPVVEPGVRHSESFNIPVGMLTERDLVKARALGLDLENCTAEAVMSTPVLAVKPENSLWTVQQKMEQHLVHQLAVTGAQGELLGIVTQTHVLQTFNPLELYKLAEALVSEVKRLEEQKIALLESRTAELEQQVALRTAALQASEQRYASLAAAAPVGIFRTDVAGRCIYVNECWCRIAGLSQNAALGEGWQQRLHPDDREWVVAEWQRSIREERAFRFEYRFRHPNGTVTWVYGQAVAERDNTGRIISYVGTITDISARKQSENALWKTEQRYREAQRIARLGNWELDLQTDRLSWSSEIFHIFEIDPEAFGASYEAFLNAIHPDDRDRVREAYRQHLNDRVPYDMTYRLLMSDSRIEYVREQCETFYAEDDTPILSQGTVQEITGLKQAELELERLNAELEERVQRRTAQLREQEARLRDFFDNASDLIQSIRLEDGQFEYVNRAWRETLGYCEAEVKTLTILDILHPDYRDRYLDRMTQLRAGQTGKRDRLELVFLTKDRREIVVEGGIDIRLENDRPGVARAIFRDVTEQRQHEEQLRNLSDRLQLAVQSAQIGIWDWDIIGDRLTWDDRICELYGTDIIDPSRTLRVWQERLHPEDADRASEAVQQALQGEKEFAVEFRVVRPDGSFSWVEAYAVVKWNDRGEPERMIGINIDISDYKQAQQQRQQLLQELSKFKLALDRSAIVAITDAKGVITYVNDLFCAISGYTRDEIIGQTHHVVNSGYHPPAFFQHLWRTIRSGQIWRGEICNRAKDGSLYWVESTLVPFLDEKGKPFQYLAIRIDVTARKLAETHIQRENTFRQKIVENMTEGLCVFHEEAAFPWVRFTVWNPKMQAITGYTLKEINQREWHHSLYPNPNVREQAIERMKRMQQGDNLMAEEWEIQRKDGQQRTISISTSVLSSQDRTVYVLALIQDITDRKASENALRQSQSFLQTVLNAFPVYVFWKDRQSVYLGCNQNFARVAGLANPEEIIGKTDYDLPWTEKEAKAYRKDDREVMDSAIAKIGIIETQVQADGRQAWLETNKIPLYDFDNQVIGVLGTYQNIRIDRTQTEKNLLESKQFIQIVLDTVPVSVFWKDRKSVYLGCNQKFAKTLGFKSPHEIVGKTDFDLITVEAEARKYQAHDRWVIQSGKARLNREEQFTLPNRKRRWLETNKVPLRDWQGQVIGVVGTFQDITDRKATEVAIKRQLAAIEAAIDGIAILQGETYLYLNRAHLELFGYDRLEELVGQSWRCLYSPEDLERFDREIFPVLERERAWQGEVRATRKDGSIFVEGISLTLTDDGLLICVCRDITDRKRAEIKLHRTNEELARATRLKDEFLANMSHELRTPLNAILGMTEGLQEGIFGEVNKKQIKALQTIERSGSHLLELINDILDVSKIEAGQIELHHASTSVASLCHSSLIFIKQQALKKRIQLEIKLPPDLPDLWVDERRIRQVVINLLNNAVKFTPQGGRIALKVTFPLPREARAKTGEFLRISAIDTGIGISSENIKKLFKPFVQIDSALNRQYTGTGLGLALVKRLVELHGGTVKVTSQVGVGSCFSIDLPCSTSTRSSPPQKIPSELNLDLKQSEGEICPVILLVEDNKANIETVSSYLRKKGYCILLAKNGLESIELARSKHPNLILMDIQMPGIDGLEAIQQIRRYPNLVDVPIIALTALAMVGDRERCLAAGANDYLSKPFKLKQLTGCIQKLLDSH